MSEGKNPVLNQLNLQRFYVGNLEPLQPVYICPMSEKEQSFVLVNTEMDRWLIG